MMDILKIGAVVGSLTVVGGAAYTAADYTDTRPIFEKEFNEFRANDFNSLQKQASDVARSVLSIRFWLLLDKIKANGQLTLDEQRELCKLAKELEYVGVPGCPNY